MVHAPPSWAEPQPLVTLRSKVSVARSVVGGGVAATVTCRVTVPVSPSSSVTVNRTVYVPSAA